MYLRHFLKSYHDFGFWLQTFSHNKNTENCLTLKFTKVELFSSFLKNVPNPSWTLCTINVCLDLPDDGPEIHGGQPRYNIGDNVNVTCISRNSLPAAKLSWYINGEKADPIYLRYVYFKNSWNQNTFRNFSFHYKYFLKKTFAFRSYPNEIIHKSLRTTGLETSRLGLTFKVCRYRMTTFLSNNYIFPNFHFTSTYLGIFVYPFFDFELD